MRKIILLIIATLSLLSSEQLSGQNIYPIVFSPIEDVTLEENQTAAITIAAINASEFIFDELPVFASFENLLNGTGRLVINPSSGTVGTYPIQVSTSNQYGYSATTNFNIEILPRSTGSNEEVLCNVVNAIVTEGTGEIQDLVDEQMLIGNPLVGSGGTPINRWFSGWNLNNYPAMGYLDLGQTQELTRIFLRDIHGSGNVKIYAGAPNNWEETPLFEDNLEGYLVWNEHRTNVSTRYLRVVLDDPNARIAELAIYGYCNKEDTNIPTARPLAITNLSLTGKTDSSTVLSWLDVNTEGNPTYELRYSQLPINESNFYNATLVTPEAYTNTVAIVNDLDCGTNYYFAVKVRDQFGNTSPVSNIVRDVTASCFGFESSDGRILTLRLNNAVDANNIDVEKATLKYDKDFAYSFMFDDGGVMTYYVAYPMLNGGVSANFPYNPATPWINFPNDPQKQEAGFTYSDGCGNQKKFKAGMALNSNNIVDGLNTGTITWDNIRTMLDDGWEVYGHGHQHCGGGNCDYDYEVGINKSILEARLDRKVDHFVVPSGDFNYYSAAHANGMNVVYNQDFRLPGKDGLPVDGTLNINELKMYRYSLDFVPAPYGQNIDMVANKSSVDNHYWMVEFCHNVGYDSNNELTFNIPYDDFKTYMQHIQENYGSDDSNRTVWMAPAKEVYEYLQVRDLTNVGIAVNERDVQIYLDMDNLPTDLCRKSLSLVVDLPAGVNIENVLGNNISVESYNPETGLLNLYWE